MTGRDSLTPEYFATLYARGADPWHFATSDYEAAKYAATLAALPRPFYAAGFEVGCSNGILTRRLGARCGWLLAVDVVASALDAARQRCRDLPQIRIQPMTVPEELPAERFDLMVLSEVAYYWSPAALDRMIDWIKTALDPGGDLVLVHWTGETDYPLTGDQVHERFLARSGFAARTDRREPCYRLTVLTHPVAR